MKENPAAWLTNFILFGSVAIIVVWSVVHYWRGIKWKLRQWRVNRDMNRDTGHSSLNPWTGN